MSDLAELTFRREGDVVLARLSGEIDLSNARDLEGAILGSVPNDAFVMLLDLTGLTYLDSAGVRLLLAVADRFRWRGQRLALVSPDGSRVRRVLSIAGVDGALIVEADLRTARAKAAEVDVPAQEQE